MIEQLPKVRGRYTENAPLGEKGWFRCGGTAEVLFKPADEKDLAHFMESCSEEIAIHIFGALSNTIIRDGGLKGVTIRLGREFSDIRVEDDLVICGALALDANVANVAAENGLGGLEFLSGIPGTIGGAVKMNAGCYGTETKDVLVEARTLDRYGAYRNLKPQDLDMSYRHTNLAQDQIVVSATFKAVKERAEDVKNRIAQIKEKREQSQPIREKTGGSTFANPSVEDLTKAGLPDDMKVWQLIEGVEGRGLEVGDAQMSIKHCNFMINKNKATAKDLESLGEEIRKRVAKAHGIELRWEIRRLGDRA